MEKETARSLIPLINSDFYDDLQIYAKHRIEHLRTKLEVASLTDVDKLQGQIAEAKRLFTLREEVLKKAE